MFIENQRVYLVDMLSGWYQATSPCPATASACDGVQGIHAVYRYILSYPRAAASVALHILFALFVELETTQLPVGVHYAHRKPESISR